MREDTRRRSPREYTKEDRANALAELNDKTKAVISFIDACILLDMASQTGYYLARKGQFPGAKRVGDVWKVTRETLRAFLYDD